jgi:signal transduction histidine kinase
LETGQSKGSLKHQLKRLEGFLAGPNAIDWRAFALAEPLLYVFGFITFYRHFDGTFAQIALIVFAGLVAEIGAAYLGRPFLAPKNRNNPLWKIATLYFFAGEINALFFIWILQIPFRDPTLGVSAWTLILTDGLLRGEWLLIAHLAISLLRSDLRLLNSLRGKARDLDALRLAANSQLANELGSLREAISEKIAIALQKISKQLDGLSASSPQAEMVEQADFVSQLCDSEVRALSHSIGQREFAPLIPVPLDSKPLRRLARTPISPRDIQLHLRWVAGIGVINAFTIGLEHGGWVGAISTLIAIGLGLVLIRALDWLRLNFTDPRRATSAIALVVCEYLTVSVVIISALWVVGGFFPEVRHFLVTVYWLVPIVVLIIWALVQLIHEFARRLRQHGDELAVQNALLADEISRVQLLAAKARNRLGKLLHGTTQGRLASVSLALAAAANLPSTQQREALFAQAREQLQLAEVDLKAAFDEDLTKHQETLEAELLSLADGWRNLVKISFEIDPRVNELLKDRQELVSAIAEAAQECVTNAVRHGQATMVSIKVNLEADLVLEAANDGNAVTEIVPGFGIRAIAEQANNVEIETLDGITTVTVRWADFH